MYRPPARSRAAPTTLCQKCLNRDIYECKSTPAERPYLSRPSRTQQLLNPKLVPKLNSDVPNDLLRKKGVADELLAKNAEERGRKHARDADDITAPSRKRSRSVSSYSSVSTVSSACSPSRSPSPYRERHAKSGASRRTDHRASPRTIGDDRKRRRRSISSSAPSYESRRTPEPPRQRDRNTRRRRSSFSPAERGRRQSRSITPEHDGMTRSRSQRRSRSRGYGSPPRRDERRYTRSPNGPRNGAARRPPSPDTRPARPAEAAPPPPMRKERSLSPYSKRLALTQAMNR